MVHRCGLRPAGGESEHKVSLRYNLADHGQTNSCAVVSVFGSGDYDRKKKVTVVYLAGCAVVSVFGSGDYNRKKKFKSSLNLY
jgi:hypothetical protein